MKYLSTNQRGDTIVEVLMSVAVLGLVFGAAYVTSNRNIVAGRATQERLEAVKVAETQVERLRVAVSDNQSILARTSSFCIPQTSDPGSALVNTSDAGCSVSANGNPADATISPRYRVSVVKTADLSSAGVTGARFEILVVWETINGTRDDSVTTYYELYR